MFFIQLVLVVLPTSSQTSDKGSDSSGSDARIVASERNISMLRSEGSDVRAVSGVTTEDSAQMDGDFCVLYEQHFIGDGLFLVTMIGKNVTLCCD